MHYYICQNIVESSVDWSMHRKKKVLPFAADAFNFTQAEEKIMKQEGYLKIDSDRYYLPEIIRHALKFKY